MAVASLHVGTMGTRMEVGCEADACMAKRNLQADVIVGCWSVLSRQSCEGLAVANWSCTREGNKVWGSMASFAR